ncbi:MAG: FIST N-terminal domain-containing protein [Bacteroidota bacterium]
MMKINLEESGSNEALISLLQQYDQDTSVEGIMILSCDANQLDPQQIDPQLYQLCKPVFGGVFPEIIHGRQKYERGSIVVGLSQEPQVNLITDLANPEHDLADIIDYQLPDLDGIETMFVMVDGLAERIGDLIRGIFEIVGQDLNIIGGGAGSLSFEQRPCIFTNEGMKEDCAQLVLTGIKSGIGVSHGWKSISGPYRVTKANGNTIEALDWQPAFDIYRKVVEAASSQTFGEGNFFDIAKGFPFGINKLGTEKVVRDPIILNEQGELVCVGEVAEGSYVDILQGNVASLVSAAQTALERGLDEFPGVPEQPLHFFIDCISRVLFLEEEFSQELDAVYQEGCPMIGALTLGEIANSGKEYLEFYNKTAVIGVLETK